MNSILLVQVLGRLCPVLPRAPESLISLGNIMSSSPKKEGGKKREGKRGWKGKEEDGKGETAWEGREEEFKGIYFYFPQQKGIKN